jgi:STE24 endopeptidase
MPILRAIISALLILVPPCAAALGAPPAPNVPFAAQPSTHFDVNAATDAWLSTVTAAARARSDAYFEGTYWLLLWNFVWLVAAMLILLYTGLSARIRDMAERITQISWLQSWSYWVGFSIVTAVLELPLRLYEDFIRERQYGLMNQTFAGWFRDELIGFCVVGLVLGGLSFVILMAIVRRLPRTWHLWGIYSRA